MMDDDWRISEELKIEFPLVNSLSLTLLRLLNSTRAFRTSLCAVRLVGASQEKSSLVSKSRTWSRPTYRRRNGGKCENLRCLPIHFPPIFRQYSHVIFAQVIIIINLTNTLNWTLDRTVLFSNSIVLYTMHINVSMLLVNIRKWWSIKYQNIEESNF